MTVNIKIRVKKETCVTRKKDIIVESNVRNATNV